MFGRPSVSHTEANASPNDLKLPFYGAGKKRTALQAVAIKYTDLYPWRNLMLSSQSNTHTGERALEAQRFGFARVDAPVDCAEEEVGAIAEAELRVGIAER